MSPTAPFLYSARWPLAARYGPAATPLSTSTAPSPGIRFSRPPEDTIQQNRELRAERVSAAQIGGVLLNAVLLDALDDDVARLQRVNRTLGFIPDGTRRGDPDRLRRIPALLLRPSQLGPEAPSA